MIFFSSYFSDVAGMAPRLRLTRCAQQFIWFSVFPTEQSFCHRKSNGSAFMQVFFSHPPSSVFPLKSFSATSASKVDIFGFHLQWNWVQMSGVQWGTPTGADPRFWSGGTAQNVLNIGVFALKLPENLKSFGEGARVPRPTWIRWCPNNNLGCWPVAQRCWDPPVQGTGVSEQHCEAQGHLRLSLFLPGKMVLSGVFFAPKKLVVKSNIQLSRLSKVSLVFSSFFAQPWKPSASCFPLGGNQTAPCKKWHFHKFQIPACRWCVGMNVHA